MVWFLVNCFPVCVTNNNILPLRKLSKVGNSGTMEKITATTNDAATTNEEDGEENKECSTASTKSFRIALIQLMTTKCTEENRKTAEKKISEAAAGGAEIVVLPEYFTCTLSAITINRESIPGPMTHIMSRLANQLGIYIVAGSIPEAIDDTKNIYNTCTVFNPEGDLIQQYRKLHLFDVNLGPGLNIKESEMCRAGNKLSTFETDVCKIGLGICTDLRFPEVAKIYADQGCSLLIYVCAFESKKVGPSQWEVLQRVRAIDNQVFVVTCAPATYAKAKYASYGHSSVTNPWGDYISTTDGDDTIVYADIDIGEIERVRSMFPHEKIRRDDLYSTEYLVK